MGKNSIDRRDFLKISSFAAASIIFPLTALGQTKAKLPQVRLGYQTHLWGAPAIIALEEDLFTKFGIRVDPKRISSGKDVRDAMVAGSLDIGTIGVTPFIVGAAKGDMSAIAVVAYCGRTLAVMAAKGSGIKSVADLKGKKIASQKGSSTEFIFTEIIAPKWLIMGSRPCLGRPW